jgi:hypothetical protein
LHDLANPVWRNLDLPRECARSQAKLRKLVAQNFTGMDWVAGHFHGVQMTNSAFPIKPSGINVNSSVIQTLTYRAPLQFSHLYACEAQVPNPLFFHKLRASGP